MNEYDEKVVKDFIEEIKSNYKSVGKEKPGYKAAFSKLQDIREMFKDKIQDHIPQFLKFHWGKGSMANCPWIEISTKPQKGKIIPFICIIFSKKTKTPYITLQLAVDDKINSQILKSNLMNYKNQIKKIDFVTEESIINLECYNKWERGYKYQHQANIYSQKYRDLSQINLFTRILNIIEKEQKELSHREILNINENIDSFFPQPQNLNEQEINFGTISLRFKNESLKDIHKKCAVCDFDHKKILQISLVKDISKLEISDIYDMEKGIVFCPLHNQLFKEEMIVLVNLNDQLIFKINKKHQEEIKRHLRWYQDWYNDDLDQFITKPIPDSYNPKEIKSLLQDVI